MDYLPLMIFVALWGTAGYYLGTRYERSGGAMVQAVALGPLGSMLFSREARREKALAERAPSTMSATFDHPVLVKVGGTWMDGRMDTLREQGGVWESKVRWSVDEVEHSGWFPQSDVRRVDGTAPDTETAATPAATAATEDAPAAAPSDASADAPAAAETPATEAAEVAADSDEALTSEAEPRRPPA